MGPSCPLERSASQQRCAANPPPAITTLGEGAAFRGSPPRPVVVRFDRSVASFMLAVICCFVLGPVVSTGATAGRRRPRADRLRGWNRDRRLGRCRHHGGGGGRGSRTRRRLRRPRCRRRSRSLGQLHGYALDSLSMYDHRPGLVGRRVCGDGRLALVSESDTGPGKAADGDCGGGGCDLYSCSAFHAADVPSGIRAAAKRGLRAFLCAGTRPAPAHG